MRYDAEHKQKTHLKVVKAAAKAIRADGPDRIGVAGVMAQAGLTHGGFYAHFRSKDDLLTALQDQFSAELAGRIRTAIDPVAGWPAKLDACVTAIFDSYQERDDLHEVLFRHGSHVSASHRATHALVLNAISDVFASGKAAGAFDVEDPEATAVLCWASTHGFDPGFHGDAAPADARLIRAAQQLFRRAAGIPGDPPG